MTSFDRIEDLAMIIIKDYRLDNLFKMDEKAFFEYVDSFLIKAIPKFTQCFNSLEYDGVLRTFTSDLSLKEQDILSDILVEVWFESLTNDITQINMHISNKEFKTYSEAQNLKEKKDYRNDLRVKYNQDIVDYQIENIAKLPFYGGSLRWQ